MKCRRGIVRAGPALLAVLAASGATASAAGEVGAVERSRWLRRCPKIAFIRRQARGRRGTNATMHGRMTGVGSAICIYDPTRPNEPARTIFEDPGGFLLDMSPSYDANHCCPR